MGAKGAGSRSQAVWCASWLEAPFAHRVSGLGRRLVHDRCRGTTAPGARRARPLLTGTPWHRAGTTFSPGPLHAALAISVFSGKTNK